MPRQGERRGRGGSIPNANVREELKSIPQIKKLRRLEERKQSYAAGRGSGGGGGEDRVGRRDERSSFRGGGRGRSSPGGRGGGDRGRSSGGRGGGGRGRSPSGGRGGGRGRGRGRR